MIKAEASHKYLVVDLLCQAFDGNPSVNYIIKQDRRRQERIKALMEYSFDTCLSSGEIWLSDNLNGCALFLYPNAKRTTLKSIYRDVQLIFKSIGIKRISLALKREGRINAIRPKIPCIYLWFIGVRPQVQQKGIGSALLKNVIGHAEKLQLPVYLETSILQNLPWYEQFGFTVYNKFTFDHTLYFLSRQRGKAFRD